MRRYLTSSAILVVLAVLQGAFLFARQADDPAVVPAAQLVLGDQVDGLDGEPEKLSLVRTDGRWTVVLAFHSECVWCERAAGTWAQWLAQPHAARVVAVTRDAPDVATAYAASHGWNTEILSVPSTRGTIEHRIVSQTPWAFVFDASGVLRYEGNGAQLDVIDDMVGSSSTETRP